MSTPAGAPQQEHHSRSTTHLQRHAVGQQVARPLRVRQAVPEDAYVNSRSTEPYVNSRSTETYGSQRLLLQNGAGGAASLQSKVCSVRGPYHDGDISTWGSRSSSADEYSPPCSRRRAAPWRL